MKEGKKITTEELLYLVCYGVWFFFCCMYLSEWRNLYPIAFLRTAFSYSAYGLLFLSIVTDTKKLSARQFFLGLSFLVVAILSAILSQTPLIASMAAFILAARNHDKRRILKVTLAVMLITFVLIFASVLFGYLPNLIEPEEGRQRWRWGYIFTSYPSHVVLFMTLIAVALSDKVGLIRALLLGLANWAIFSVTDTKADFGIALLILVLAFAFSLVPAERITDRWGAVFIALPLLCLLISYLSQYFFDPENEIWNSINRLVHGRLYLGHNMMLEKPHTLLGQKIKWVGANSNSKLSYNFVDNSYLHCGLNQGILYLGWILTFYSCAMFRFVKKSRPLICLAVAGILLHGLIDPQMEFLYWQPFLLFGCMLFEDHREENHAIPIRQEVYL